jgi:hypothetical protein
VWVGTEDTFMRSELQFSHVILRTFPTPSIIPSFLSYFRAL